MIERKFLVKMLPKLFQIKSSEIEQFYISFTPEIEVVKQNNEYYIICSSNDCLEKKEVKLEITSSNYKQLRGISRLEPIKKTRYYVNTYELDIYHNIKALITVRVKFNTEEEAKYFLKPDWFGDEITYIEEFKDKNLIKRSTPTELKCCNCNGKGHYRISGDLGANDTIEVCECCQKQGVIPINEIDIQKYNDFTKSN